MTETVDSTRLREHIEVGRNAWEAMRSLTADETFDVVTELLAHRELLSLRQSDTRIEGCGEKCPECGKPLAECEAGYADAFATPEHVEGDVLSVGEMERFTPVLRPNGRSQDASMAADPDGLWVRLTSATTRIQRAERERDAHNENATKWFQNFSAAVRRAEAAESRLADALKVPRKLTSATRKGSSKSRLSTIGEKPDAE